MLKRLAIIAMLALVLALMATPAIAQVEGLELYPTTDYSVEEAYPTTDQGYNPLWEQSTYCDQGICTVYECPAYGLGACSVLYTYYDPSWYYVDPLGYTYY